MRKQTAKKFFHGEMWVTQTSKTAGKKIKSQKDVTWENHDKVSIKCASLPRIFMMYYILCDRKLQTRYSRAATAFNTLLLTESQLRWETENQLDWQSPIWVGICFRTWRNRRAWHVRTRPRRPNSLVRVERKENKKRGGGWHWAEYFPTINRNQKCCKSSTSNQKAMA